ncbi:MAG TPA: hypothetical protein VGC79_17890, partial [Polyangiaceae bacterium]
SRVGQGRVTRNAVQELTPGAALETQLNTERLQNFPEDHLFGLDLLELRDLPAQGARLGVGIALEPSQFEPKRLGNAR